MKSLSEDMDDLLGYYGALLTFLIAYSNFFHDLISSLKMSLSEEWSINCQPFSASIAFLFLSISRSFLNSCIV
jgi:hypothetical protein